MNNKSTNSSRNEILESLERKTSPKGVNKEIAIILESDFDSLFNEENLIKHQSRNLDKTLNELKARIEARYTYIKNTAECSSNYIKAELSIQKENKEKAERILNSFDSERTETLQQYITHRQLPENDKDKQDLVKYISGRVRLHGAEKCEQLLIEKQSKKIKTP